MKRKLLLSNISDDDFISLVKKSKSWFELLKQIGYSFSKALQKRDQYPAAPKKQCMKRIEKLKIDHSHLDYQHTPLEKLIQKRRGHAVLHKKMQEAGRLYICEWCRCDGMELWNGEWLWRDWPIKLQIDHIHGRNIEDPDKLDNLRYLCPNCHTQTHNWAGRQWKGKKRPGGTRSKRGTYTVS